MRRARPRQHAHNSPAAVLSVFPAQRAAKWTVSDTRPHFPHLATHSAPHRKVLIVEDEPAIRNVLYVLLTNLGCEGEVAQSSRQALAMIRRDNFDAVLLDLRCSEVPAQQVMAEIQEIQPQLVGRVLVITGQVADRQTLDLVEQYCVPVIPRDRVMQEVWAHLRPVLGFAH